MANIEGADSLYIMAILSTNIAFDDIQNSGEMEESYILFIWFALVVSESIILTQIGVTYKSSATIFRINSGLMLSGNRMSSIYAT